MPTSCRFVDIGTYGPGNRESVERSLKEAAWFSCLGRCKWLVDGKDLRILPNEPPATSTHSVEHAPRPFAEWQRSLDGISTQLSARDSAIPVLFGQCPSTSWVYLGRALSHSNPTPIIINQAPPSLGGELQLFDFKKANSWWSRVSYGWNVPAGPLLAVESKQLVSSGTGIKNAVILFVTPTEQYRLSTEQQQFIETSLREHGFTLRATIDIRPANGKNIIVQQDNLLALQTEMESVLKDQRSSYGHDGRLDAVAIVTSGPAPLAFIVGKTLRPNLDGRLFTFERSGSETVLAYDSGRR